MKIYPHISNAFCYIFIRRDISEAAFDVLSKNKKNSRPSNEIVVATCQKRTYQFTGNNPPHTPPLSQPTQGWHNGMLLLDFFFQKHQRDFLPLFISASSPKMALYLTELLPHTSQPGERLLQLWIPAFSGPVWAECSDSKEWVMMTEIKQACYGEGKSVKISKCMCECVRVFLCCLQLVTRSDQSKRWRQSQRERVRQRSNLCEYLVSLCRKRKKPIYSINHLPLAHICLSQFLSCFPPFYILMFDSYGLLQTRPKFNENSVEQANMLSRSCLAQMSPPA